MPKLASVDPMPPERALAPEREAPTPDAAEGYTDHCPDEGGIDEAAVIRRHVPMVKRLAAHLRGRMPQTVELDDLVQAGLMAVLRIVRQSPSTSPSDAMLRRAIVNAMIDEVRRESWAPVRVMRLAKATTEAMRAIKRRTGRDATDEEIAAEMRISVSEYQRLLLDISGMRLLSLDAFEESEERRMQVPESQESGLDRQRTMAALAGAITGLPEREKLVVSLYYEHELNMEEVGKVLGLDKSTVCRAHGRALLTLRSALGEPDMAGTGPWSMTGG